MALLSRLATLGLGKEGSGTPGVYQAPTWAVPFTKAQFDDVINPERDESVRGNDSVLQGLYQGIWDATWDIDCLVYPDLIGMMLRGMIGPDTVTAGVTTTLASGSAPGAGSIVVAAAIPTGSTIMIDTGANVEYAVTGVQTGSAPNITTPLTATGTGTTLTKTHANGAAVVSQTQHVFKQSPTTALPTYSLTVYDVQQTLGYMYGRFTDLQLKIDAKAMVTLNSKLITMPFTIQSSVTENYTSVAPFQGWSWTTTQAGSASSRGLTLDLTLKRAAEAIHGSLGQQAARENFVGAIDVDGGYKAIFENQTDLANYLNNTQNPFVAGLKIPLGLGGQTLSLTMSQAGWYKGSRDLSGLYTMATFSLAGVQNTTDGGVVQATLNNWVTTAY
jgi:hypothetical protein